MMNREHWHQRQMNLFDYGDWGGYFGHMKQEENWTEGQRADWKSSRGKDNRPHQ